MYPISEEQIGFRAYHLWELAGKPPVDDDRFWQEAAAELRFRRARQELEKRMQDLSDEGGR